MDAVERSEQATDIYEPPALTELGSFTELTRGGIDGGADFAFYFTF